MTKTKIVLDADVLIHFSKADRLSILPEIFKEYDYVILSAVYDEVKSIRKQIDNQIAYIGNIRIEKFVPTGEMRKEYAELRNNYGKGESACMAYCRFTHDVIGSSNLKDIKKYCNEQHIIYLTTMDFLFYAYSRKLMTEDECHEFIKIVKEKGSKLPDNEDITNYTPSVLL